MSADHDHHRNESMNRGNISENSQQCVICCDSIENGKAGYVDYCMHQFCFDCLKKWCEVKAECPLCKRQIQTIFFDVQSPGTFKQFCPMSNETQQISIPRQRGPNAYQTPPNRPTFSPVDLSTSNVSILENDTIPVALYDSFLQDLSNYERRQIVLETDESDDSEIDPTVIVIENSVPIVIIDSDEE